MRLIEWFPHRIDGLRDTCKGWKTRSRTRGAMRDALKRLYSDRILITKLGRAPTKDESDDWFAEFYTNPPCKCNKRARRCTTICTTCGDCVNKHGGAAFDHTEALETEVEKIPGGFAFLALMRNADVSRASRAADAAKYLVAWHRPCTQCIKCNKFGLVDFADRSGLTKIPGAAAREKAAERKADEITKILMV